MNPSHQIHDPAADEQAALWAARLEGSSLTAADQAALDAWLAENPAHRTLLSQYCQFSADLEEQLPALVAAGAVAMPLQPSSPFAKARADTQGGSARRGWNHKWFAGAALAAAALVMFTIWLARPGRQSASFTTAAARRQSITLVDGTRVELNARTSLQVEIGGAERHVHLAAGEAFFTVSKDPNRPFIVETPAGSVRVTGTIFSVHTETPSELNVTVVEGSVLVRPGAMGGARAPDPVSLHARDRLTAGPGGVSVQALTASALEDELAWRQGMVVFNNVPLRDALARFAYYHERDIAATMGAENLSVGGRYSLDDLDGFFAALKLMQLPVRVTSGSGGKVRVSLLTEP